LQALRVNDPAWIRSQAFDITALRRKSRRIEEFGDVEVQKKAQGRESHAWVVLKIELIVPLPTGMRLDRLLAAELRISRSRLEAFQHSERLRSHPAHQDMLRRRIKDGLRITLDLTGEADLQDFQKAATGE
jgi:hypothetical protein